MDIFEIILIGIGLAMDAFAVSICKGLSMKRMSWKKALIVATYFGVFQAFMPVLGFLLGTTFSGFVQKVNHWIAFLLLTVIGVNMIKGSPDENLDKNDDRVDFKSMFILAIATSIDALAIGVTFSFFKANIFFAVSIVGVITFLLSAIGVKVGNKFGDKFQNKSELAGGIILIIIGLKILLQ